MIWQKLKSLFGGEAAIEGAFRAEWIALLEEVPLYARLPDALRLGLHERIGRFVGRVRFEGCGGLELTGSHGADGGRAGLPAYDASRGRPVSEAGGGVSLS